VTDHAAYLDAKRALNDRSLNRAVLDRFAAELPPEPEILEVGAGSATMVERLAEWDVIESGRWIAVDAHEAALAAGEARVGDAVGGVDAAPAVDVATGRRTGTCWSGRSDGRSSEVVGAGSLSIRGTPGSRPDRLGRERVGKPLQDQRRVVEEDRYPRDRQQQEEKQD